MNVFAFRITVLDIASLWCCDEIYQQLVECEG